MFRKKSDYDRSFSSTDISSHSILMKFESLLITSESESSYVSMRSSDWPQIGQRVKVRVSGAVWVEQRGEKLNNLVLLFIWYRSWLSFVRIKILLVPSEVWTIQGRSNGFKDLLSDIFNDLLPIYAYKRAQICAAQWTKWLMARKQNE